MNGSRFQNSYTPGSWHACDLLENSCEIHNFQSMAEVFAVEILLELNERSSSIFVLSGTVRVKFI